MCMLSRGAEGVPGAIFRKLSYRYLLMETVWRAEFSRATLYCRGLTVVKISDRKIEIDIPAVALTSGFPIFYPDG